MGGPDHSWAVYVHVDHVLEDFKGDPMPVPCDPHEVFADRVEGFGFVPGRAMEVLVGFPGRLDSVDVQDGGCRRTELCLASVLAGV